MAENRAEKILQTLQKNFTLPSWVASGRYPFKTLITTIISQNTADRNTARAFENLSKNFQITPKALAKAEKTRIEECLRTAGLYRNKARLIKEISRIILEKFGGSLKPILSMPFEEARKTLMQLPGVGPKTADVVLLFSSKQPTIPVDTHVKRVSKRLGLASADKDYEDIRKALQSLYKPEDYLNVHIMLILLGRKYCRAKNPLCQNCPVNIFCPSRRK